MLQEGVHKARTPVFQCVHRVTILRFRKLNSLAHIEGFDHVSRQLRNALAEGLRNSAAGCVIGASYEPENGFHTQFGRPDDAGADHAVKAEKVQGIITPRFREQYVFQRFDVGIGQHWLVTLEFFGCFGRSLTLAHFTRIVVCAPRGYWNASILRSEERRVGKECRSRWWMCQ